MTALVCPKCKTECTSTAALAVGGLQLCQHCHYERLAKMVVKMPQEFNTEFIDHVIRTWRMIKTGELDLQNALVELRAKSEVMT